MFDIVYAIEAYPSLDVDEFVNVLRRSTLGERRPIDDRETIRGMLEHADVIVTARLDGRLIGISLRDHRFQLLHLPVRPGRGRDAPTSGGRQGADPPHS